MTSEIEPILDVEVIENIDELVDEYVDGPEGWRLFLELPVSISRCRVDRRG